MPAAVAPVSMMSVVPVMTVAVSLPRSRLCPAAAAVSAAGPGGRGRGSNRRSRRPWSGVREREAREELGAELELSREESE